MYYYLIIALQIYCIYHCLTNKNDYYWVFIIFFVPAIGSLVYLFVNVIQKRDINKVQSSITSIINPTKKITDLEKKFKFAATFENQYSLADAYLEAGFYDKAIENYEACLKGTFQNDFYVLSQLLQGYYFSSQFKKSIEIADKIKTSAKFEKSNSSFLYALALEKTGDIKAAEEYLIPFDSPYNRYQERLDLAKFYIRNAKTDKAKEILKEIELEAEGMSKTSYKQNRILIKKAKELLNSGI